MMPEDSRPIELGRVLQQALVSKYRREPRFAEKHLAPNSLFRSRYSLCVRCGYRTVYASNGDHGGLARIFVQWSEARNQAIVHDFLWQMIESELLPL